MVPFYKNEDLVRQITDSILEIKDEILKYQFEIVFVNDSPDYLPLAEAFDYHQRRLKGLSHRLITNPQNLRLSECLQCNLGRISRWESRHTLFEF